MKKYTPRPLSRSGIRLYFGKKYFTIKRHVKMRFSGYKFPKAESNTLPYLYFSHKTPLYRQLKDVDMWMQENKVINLSIAAPKLNGLMLRPGETLSYWHAIGKPTSRKGYKPGMILKSGTVTSGVGGGLCQLSNLVYWLTIHTPLTVIERHRHGFDVFPDSNRTQPFGSGATCFYNYCDLIIQNNTCHTYQLCISMDATHLLGAWRCNHQPLYKYEVYEKDHIMQSEFWGGHTRHNTIYRKKFDETGFLISDEYVVENHAIMMYAPLIGTNVEG